MTRVLASERRFLFLQGPHGPFFFRLAEALRAEGASVLKIGTTRGDRLYWRDSATYLSIPRLNEGCSEQILSTLDTYQITDLVIYGTTRPLHAEAISAAKVRNVCVHVFEEGYIRPHWVTYERGGSNGHSRLCDIDVIEMARALEQMDRMQPDVADRWGDLRAHMFHGALYHAAILTSKSGRRGAPTHRDISVRREAYLAFRRFLLLPWHAVERFIATTRVRTGDFAYHVVLMQLAHDANFLHFGPFQSAENFLETVVASFAKNAAPSEHLVLKEHPLEDDRARVRSCVRDLVKKHGLSGRAHYVSGGKLARLLDGAQSAVTVNSTAAQQAMWRGLPIFAFGDAVYAKAGLISDQTIEAFFQNPQPPDAQSYEIFRAFLLATSQFPGSFYSTAGRKRLIPSLVAPLLADDDPYDRIMARAATHTQQSGTTSAPPREKLVF